MNHSKQAIQSAASAAVLASASLFVGGCVMPQGDANPALTVAQHLAPENAIETLPAPVTTVAARPTNVTPSPTVGPVMATPPAAPVQTVAYQDEDSVIQTADFLQAEGATKDLRQAARDQQPAAATKATPNVTPNSPQSVRQVGWNDPIAARRAGFAPVPAARHDNLAQRHDNSCRESSASGCSCCSKSPYFTSGPWNQFGIDPNEFLCDGGDLGDNAHVRQDDKIVGIDLEDTVVRYTTEAGEIHVQPSNRVCIYAPRFAAVRRVTEAAAGGRIVAAQGYDLPEGPLRIDINQPSSAVSSQDGPERQVLARTPDAMRELNRGVPVEAVDQPLLAEDVLAVLANLTLITRGQLTEAEKPWLSKGALAAETWSLQENVAVTVNELKPFEQIHNAAAEGLTVYEFPDAGRLRICKLADKQNALPGEIVTFLLRVDNVGDSPVRNVVLTDNLTTRLEYVEDSQTCSVGAVFDTEANVGGSLRLSWKLTDTLKVGESASIRFQCKVR